VSSHLSRTSHTPYERNRWQRSRWSRWQRWRSLWSRWRWSRWSRWSRWRSRWSLWRRRRLAKKNDGPPHRVLCVNGAVAKVVMWRVWRRILTCIDHQRADELKVAKSMALVCGAGRLEARYRCLMRAPNTCIEQAFGMARDCSLHSDSDRCTESSAPRAAPQPDTARARRSGKFRVAGIFSLSAISSSFPYDIPAEKRLTVSSMFTGYTPLVRFSSGFLD
jgi:hypothetical protein